ncbi:hypothetical protein FHX37_2823 [Haloactinospora alba]|uniref:Uncharacterized protein n=1 Tax=Haloactinospora alba TaxID=405555 RepID=A0A543NLW9_9ACTN|nr:hypothetical protein [Haloactinospora alba]TQN32838.1 hypothetical protein FHX37_2823 [Haloactinospora alba]
MTLPETTRSPAPANERVRAVLRARHGQRFSRVPAQKRQQQPHYTSEPDPYSGNPRVAYRRRNGEAPAWMRHHTARETPALSPHVPAHSQISRSAASAPACAPQRENRPATEARPRSRGRRHARRVPSRYRRFKCRLLRGTGGQAWVYFAAVEVLPYTCTVTLIVLLTHALGFTS